MTIGDIKALYDMGRISQEAFDRYVEEHKEEIELMASVLEDKVPAKHVEESQETTIQMR